VRFLLSPPPEEMETRSRKAKNAVPQGILTEIKVNDEDKVPKDSRKPEPVMFGSSSGWGREQLRLLGVDFYMQRRIDLNKVLNVNEREWTPQMRQSIHTRFESY
jgi:hypothetical protein